MNTKIRKIGVVLVGFCIILLIGICVKANRNIKKLSGTIELLSSYAAYSTDMLKDMSVDSMSSIVFPAKNTLIYCFSEDMCDECIYQDLAELENIQKEIGKDNVLVLPAYSTSRANQIILKNKLNDFKYINISTDSIKFPFHRENGMEQRFFAFTDESGRIRSFFFPQKNQQNMTRIYLNKVKI